MAQAPPAPPFDPEKFKRDTREQWSRVAKSWSEWAPTLKQWVGPATVRMLDMACIAPGQRVLDIAAGAGSQTLEIAARVGPTGYVLATDLTPAILEFAGENARNAGFANVDTRVMDGERIDVEPGSFDAAICRLGLMFFTDLPAGLAQIRRAIKRGGRLGAIVFTTPEKNPTVAIPNAICRRYAHLPPPAPDQPGAFRLGPPGVARELLLGAGFTEIEEQVVVSPLRLQSTAEYMRFATSSFGALHAILAGLPQSEQDVAWREIEQTMKQFDGRFGFEGPCEHLVIAGRA